MEGRSSRPLRLSALAVLALSALLAVLIASTSASAETHQVDLINASFSPQSLTIVQGDTVLFTNRDNMPHDVTFEDGNGSGAAGGMSLGDTYSRTFTTAGTFRLRCQVHSATFNNGMIGQIIVLDATLVPNITADPVPDGAHEAGVSFTITGTASDRSNVTAVYVQVDGGTSEEAFLSPVQSGNFSSVNWSYNISSDLAPGDHTIRVFGSNGAYNSSATTITISLAPAGGPGGRPSGNPFGSSSLFEDIMTNYFWLLTGVGLIALVIVVLFLMYSGKLQNYYVVLLTAMDERMRLFAFTRPTREFLYTIQRQMPRTHTERYNLKVIWYWYPLYCLGGLAFASFIILTITGIILGFYYIPEGTGPNSGLPSKAYESMETIMTKVTFGYIFRALHHWGAHMMIATVFLHMMRVYFVGAYKNPRELNWLLGVVLFLVTILFGYTGYLLPWDQLAYWAGTIGLGMSQSVPIMGDIIGNMLFGGPELSGATIIRMYYLHVFVLPLIGGALMVLHMGIVWMQGVAEPH